MILGNILQYCTELPAYSNIKGSFETNEWRKKLNKMQDYINLYANAFDYEGLPNEFTSLTGKNRMWLIMKFFAPAVCFFKEAETGLQCLPVCGMGNWNIAGLPEKWVCYSANGRTFKRDKSNSVIIFNDYAFSIPFLKLLPDLEAMLECDLTHMQNLKAQRQPLIIEMEEDEKKSASTFISQLDNEVIKVRKRSNKDSKRSDRPYETRAFESGRSFQGDVLGSDYRYFENRILTRLGYNNENLEKKERLLVDEVNSNNEIVDSFFTSRLECEVEGFNNVNKMFGYNIRVVPRTLKNFKKEVADDKSTVIQQGKPSEKSDRTLEEKNRE